MNRNSFILAGIPIASPQPQDSDSLCYDAKRKQWVYRQTTNGMDGKDGVDGMNGADGRDGKSCTCTKTETAYFANSKQDLKKGDDLVLNVIHSNSNGVFLVDETTVKIDELGLYEVTFSAGRNEFGILTYKGSNFTFLLNVKEEGIELKCIMLSMAKVIEENSCLLKIVKLQ